MSTVGGRPSPSLRDGSGEGLRAAQRRQEAGVARLLDPGPGTNVVDIGCGVSGPPINVAKATGTSIKRLNFKRTNALKAVNGT